MVKKIYKEENDQAKENQNVLCEENINEKKVSVGNKTERKCIRGETKVPPPAPAQEGTTT